MARTEKTALITGSGRKIGRAIALHLAERGFNIVVNGSSSRDACEAVAKEVRGIGPEAMVAMADVGDRAAVQSMAQEALEEFGAIDVLVNNAAHRSVADFLEVSEEDFDRVMNIDFKAAFWLSRAFLPGMIERGWGRIVNFSGMNAQQGHMGRCHVTVAKHAAWGLTKAIAKDYGRHGITANIISPGTILDFDESPEGNDRLMRLQEQNPSGRLGNPNDIAGMVDLLISKEGSFINGQIFHINGGVMVP